MDIKNLVAVMMALVLGGAVGVQVGGCHHSGMARPVELSGLSTGELRSALADLAQAHEQKVMLALWVGTLRPVDAPFKAFYSNMGTQQRELLGELKAWAGAHQVDLTFQYPDDVAGRTQKILDARQEKLVRGDSREDFERDNLMQMYSDYEYQISEIQAILPSVKDADLRAYLEKSEKVHEAGSAEIMGLLKRYKFGG